MSTIALIQEAILALKDPSGSSLQAINKWIETEKPKYARPKKHVINAALVKGIEDGKIVKDKASYKLGPIQCGTCGLMKRLYAEDGFTWEQMQQRYVYDRRCLSCLNGTSRFKVCRGVLCYHNHQSFSPLLKPLSSEKFRLAQWDRDCKKPLCKSCEDIDWQSRARGVGCPLTSWAKLINEELPVRIVCEACDGHGSLDGSFEDCELCDGRGATISDEPIQDEIEVALKEERVTREELLKNGGDWSVIMTAGYRLARLVDERWPNHQFQSQEVKGSLTFTKADGGQVNGTVEMQPDSEFLFLSKGEEANRQYRNQYALGRSCKLILKEASSEDIASYEQKIENDTHGTEYLRIASNALAVKANYGEDLPEQAVTGIIQVVKGRVALLTLNHKGRDPINLDTIESNSIPASEGDMMMDKYRNVAGYWLCTKLGTEHDVARIIRQYLCPAPVFFLESGDLFIRNMKLDMVERNRDVNTCQPILLVARPNKRVGH